MRCFIRHPFVRMMARIMKVRIQKLLAAVGLDSRRHIEEMVVAGRVSVNGKKVRTLPVMVDETTDRVEVDGAEVYAPASAKRRRGGADNRRADPEDTSDAMRESLVYVVMNKPEKVYSTNVAQGEQQRAIDLLPAGFRTRVYPVGRLDAESRGLLLLTNDGDLTNKLTHPKYGVAKVYRAVVDGFVHGDLIAQMKAGVWLADSAGGAGVKARAAQVEIVKRLRERSILDITLAEGRNRQVRRMLAKLGHKVRTLTRIKFGPLDLNQLALKPGESRLLTPREVTALKRAADRADGKPAATVNAPAKPAKPKQSGPINQLNVKSKRASKASASTGE